MAEDAGAVALTFPIHTVAYPVLKKLGKQNIRKSLREREAYVREINERKAQDGITLGKPVSLTFSVDPAVLASFVDLCQLGTQIDHINKVTDAVISQWLESHKEVKKDTLSASQVKYLVEKSLRINVSEKDDNQRILILFADYTSLLRVHGLSWVIQDHPKKAVEHILDAITPKHLQSRLRDDLAFSHENLKKDFIASMKHAASRAEHSGEFEDLEPATVQAKLSLPIRWQRPKRIGGHQQQVHRTKQLGFHGSFGFRFR
jgi:hypothetical protein